MQHGGQVPASPEETAGWEKISEFHYPNGDDDEPSLVTWQHGQLLIHYSTYGSNGRSLSSRRYMAASNDEGALFDRRGGVRRFRTFTAAKEAILATHGQPDNEGRADPKNNSLSSLQLLDRTINPILGSKY